jgi:cell division protein FtsB
MTFKQKVLRLFFAFEIGVFIVLYIFGSQGLRATRAIAQECSTIEQTIARVRADIKGFKAEIVACESDALHKERIAREQLQMARADDTVYFIN